MIQNHFTATGIVFNSENKILMVHHNKLQVWLPPGGHIDENELPDDAVIREIFEETGVNAKVISLKRELGFIDSCRELETPFAILLEDIEGNGTHNHIDMVYLCRALSEELKPQDAEVHGIGWFTYDEIKQLTTYDNVVKIIFKAIEHLNNSAM